MSTTHNSTPKECTGVEIKVPWGHISGKWWGPQKNRPILALHGWQDNAGTFDTLIPLLSADIGILAIDLPGHGFSSRMPDGLMYHTIDYVYVVRMIMKEYNWDKVSIMGHSMGAIVGIAVAGIFPDDIDMLIILDSYKPGNYLQHNFGPIMRHIIKSFLIADERNRGESEPPSYSYDECIEKLYLGAASSIDQDKCPFILNRNIAKSSKYPDKYYFTRDSRIKNMNPSILPQEMYTKFLTNIKCPVLFIRALDSPLHDDIKTFEENMAVFRKNAHFEYHEADGRHHVHLNEPHKICETINGFLSKHAPKSARQKSKL